MQSSEILIEGGDSNGNGSLEEAKMVLLDELGGDEKIVVVPRLHRLVSNDSAGSFSNPSKSAHLNEMESKLVGFIEKLLKEISSSDATS